MNNLIKSLLFGTVITVTVPVYAENSETLFQDTEKDALINVSLSSSSALEAEAMASSSADQCKESCKGSRSRIDMSEIVRMELEARIDYQRDWLAGHTVKNNTGFEGKYINVRIDGCIVPGLTYSWRHRFNKLTHDANFFDACDWLYLNYDIKDWSFQVGKEVVMIGGYEYDRAPIDLYSCSVFWNNIPCYDLGVSVGYGMGKNDRLYFQAVQSPFYTRENRDMYGYSLMWSGNHGWYKSLWSANLFEYAAGKYINYLALGNRFEMDKWALELDLMNRASSHQTFFFKDCSIMAELQYKPASRWNIFAKYTYDVNTSGTAADATVMDGTHLNMIGGGLEFFPLLKKKTSLRLHANCFYSWGRNANPGNVMQNKSTMLDFGVTWYMNLFRLSR